jgi:hypothetical protein
MEKGAKSAVMSAESSSWMHLGQWSGPCKQNFPSL